MEYNTENLEKKWKPYWQENATYKVENNSSKPKFYVLDMFPYPSGAGLHVGHPLGYIASDIYARFKRLKGFNVLHPMGYDAFGLPAEQYAIQTGVHPAVSTADNIRFYRKQLDNLGFSFDWSRQVNTSEPSYYKWTQWIFLKLFDHYYDLHQQKAEPINNLVAYFEHHGNLNCNASGSLEFVFSAQEWKSYDRVQKEEILMNYRLAYRKLGYVNWCPALGTVLANDEIKDGLSERGGHPVVKKPMKQWALRITAYAERLLSGLETVDFSEALKTQQINWIGKSQGAKVEFMIDGYKEKLEIFTTRPDTIFGATFMVLAPEHGLLSKICTPDQKKEVVAYIKYTESRSERDRMSDVKSVSGAFTGAFAVNPLNGKKIPIWIADYVLIGYGTGAIMAVPSNDERDERFAQHFGIDIIPVVDQSGLGDVAISEKKGKMINSDFLNGMEVLDAIEAVIEKMESLQLGQRKINYRLRDANFSRQRYWGEPFPIKYDQEGVPHKVTELPLQLPALDNFKPTKEGLAPLNRAKEWVDTNDYTRETDTMPGFAGSSWYFLRYMDPENTDAPFSESAVKYWQDVDLYVGGAEHAVGHLMYSRFWHKFLFDIGKVPTEEPYRKLINQGMLQGVIEFIYLQKEKENGKSIFVSADLIQNEADYAQLPVHIDFVSDYGAESSYLDQKGVASFINWRPEFKDAEFKFNTQNKLITRSEIGKISKRYFNVVNPDDVVSEYGTDCFRMYEMFLGPLQDSKPWDTKGINGVSKFLRKFWSLFFDQNGFSLSEEEANKAELKILHTAIKKINHDIEQFSFNTCIAHFMVACNDLKKIECNKKSILEPLVVLMAPFAPFITEELWHLMGNQGSIHAFANYPIHEDKYLIEDSIEYPVCINGKKRASVSIQRDAEKTQIELQALELEEIKKWLVGKEVKKVIVVPSRMVNIVV